MRPWSIRVTATVTVIGAIWILPMWAKLAHVGTQNAVVIVAIAVGAFLAGVVLALVGMWDLRVALVASIGAASILVATATFERPPLSMGRLVAGREFWFFAVASAMIVTSTLLGVLVARGRLVRPSPLTIVTLSAFVMVGMASPIDTVLTLAGDVGLQVQRELGPICAIALIAPGFVTQAMVPTRRPWMCSGGFVLLFVLHQYLPHRLLGGQIIEAGCVAFVWVFGAMGAGIAARVFARLHQPWIPEARINR